MFSAMPFHPFHSLRLPLHRPLSLQFSFLSLSLLFLHCTKSDAICIYITSQHCFPSSHPLLCSHFSLIFLFVFLLLSPSCNLREIENKKKKQTFKTNKVLNSDSNVADNFFFWVLRIHVLRGDSSIIGLFGLPGFFFFFLANS